MNRRSFFIAAAKSLMAAGAIASLVDVGPAEASPGKGKGKGGKRRNRRGRKAKGGKKGGKKA